LEWDGLPKKSDQKAKEAEITFQVRKGGLPPLLIDYVFLSKKKSGGKPPFLT